MKKLLLLSLVWLIAIPAIASATDVSGNVSGEWTVDNSPYNVVGELTVPTDSTLIIDPGVSVIFQGHYKFNVETSATLIAAGTESDSIVFTAANTSEGWWGIRFFSASDISRISYCHIEYGRATGNEPDNDGGAIYCSYSNPSISNNTISDNSADYGGGIFCDHSDPIISYNTISNNLGTWGGGGIYCINSDPTINGNTISNNSAYTGGGIYCNFSNSDITNNTISENSANGYNNNHEGGGIYCCDSSPTIMNNTISDNSADYGGGIYFISNSSPMINNNTITGNSAFNGGGIYCNSSDPTISGNTISNNSAYEGGGIYCYETNMAITNNTISNNSADYRGGGIRCRINSNLTVINTILWADSAPYGNEIDLDNSVYDVTYSDIQGGWGGEGNIDADPLFVNPDNGDYHLQEGSPCIDAGDPNSPPDPDGTIADMGAFYYNPLPSGGVIYNPEDFIFTIAQNLTTFRNYQITSGDSSGYVLSFCNAPWVTLDPDYVEMEPNDTVMVTATFNPGELPFDSTYTTDITFASDIPGFQGDPIPVEMTVIPPADIVLDYNPDDFLFDILRDSVETKYFNLICNQNSALSVSYVKMLCDSSWISFEPDSVNMDPGDTITVAAIFDATGLYYRSYDADIYFESDMPSMDGVIIPTEMTVRTTVGVEASIADNILSVGDTLAVDITVTNPTSQNLYLWLATAMELPGGYIYGPVFGPYDFRLFPDGGVYGTIKHIVPEVAPAGDYQYLVRVSPQDDMAFAMGEGSAPFSITGSAKNGEMGDNAWGILYYSFDNNCNNLQVSIPKKYSVGNYPNPFNAQTTISFDVPTAGNVSLEVYNIMGQKVATLVKGNIEAGSHTVIWDAGNYSSGIYFYKLTAGNKVFTKRMTLLK